MKAKFMIQAALAASLLLPATLQAYPQGGFFLPEELESKAEQKAEVVNILGNWRVSIIEIDGAFMRVPEAAGDVSLQVNSNQIMGVAGCNNFMLPYTPIANTQQITIKEGASTRKMCHPEEVMKFEDSFLRLLSGTFMVEKNFEGITLVRENVKIYLVR